MFSLDERPKAPAMAFEISVVSSVVVLSNQTSALAIPPAPKLKAKTPNSMNPEDPRTYSFAKTPLKAAQAPLAMAKKIHCVRTLQDPAAAISAATGCWDESLAASEGDGSGFFRWRAIFARGLYGYVG